MNRRGEITLAAMALVALGAVIIAPLVLKAGNPFDRSADPSNRRTASSLSGKDIVEITRAAGDAKVDVRVDRSVEASSEITDPKLTLGQKIGRFFSGLTTWSVLGLLFLFCALGVSPSALLAWSRHKYRSAFKNTVAGIREMDDKEAYEKVTLSISKKQDKRDKKLVDKVKAELH